MTLAKSEESPFFYIVVFLRFYSRDGAGSSHCYDPTNMVAGSQAVWVKQALRTKRYSTPKDYAYPRGSGSRGCQ